jgi:hypothetical protein
MNNTLKVAATVKRWCRDFDFCIRDVIKYSLNRPVDHRLAVNSRHA